MSKKYILYAAIGLIIILGVCLLIYISARPNAIANPYKPITDYMGRVIINQVEQLTTKDITIKELRQQLALKPVEQIIYVSGEVTGTSTEPDVDIEYIEDAKYKVTWSDLRAHGWIELEGIYLKDVGVIGSYQEHHPIKFDLEIVKSGNEMTGAIGNEYVLYKDEWIEPPERIIHINNMHVLVEKESIFILIPKLILGTDKNGAALGGGIQADINRLSLEGYYAKSDFWGGGIDYRFDWGLGLGCEFDNNDIKAEASFKIDF